MTTTPGSAFQTANSQDNALAVGIDAPSQVTRIEAILDDPPVASGSAQAGLWFGNDEDNYVKLVVIRAAAGPRSSTGSRKPRKQAVPACIRSPCPGPRR